MATDDAALKLEVLGRTPVTTIDEIEGSLAVLVPARPDVAAAIFTELIAEEPELSATSAAASELGADADSAAEAGDSEDAVWVDGVTPEEALSRSGLAPPPQAERQATKTTEYPMTPGRSKGERCENCFMINSRHCVGEPG